MKKFTFLLILLSFRFGSACFGDVINIGEHYVQKCVKITNVNDYPEITLLGYIIGVGMTFDTYAITSSECLTKGYKYNDFNIFAVKKAYLNGKDIQKLILPKDPNAIASSIRIEPFGGYLNDSIPISEIEQYYKIVGFSKNEVILHKWKEITRFSNGKPDSISTYTYAGDISQLYQEIQVGISSRPIKSSIEIYPNPVNKSYHLKISNDYQGNIPVKMVNLDGKVVKSFNLKKSASSLDSEIGVDGIAKGTYYLSIKLGEKAEFIKLLIQ